MIASLHLHAQQSVLNFIENYSGLTAAQTDSLKKEAIKKIFHNPDLYNDLWAKVVQNLKTKNASGLSFMRDMNFKFKTFQADSVGNSLGAQYKYENAWSKNTFTKKRMTIQDIGINLNGNIAFKKRYNPHNLLESELFYDGSFIWGGAVSVDKQTSIKIQMLEDSILEMRERKDPAFLSLYDTVNSYINVSNQYFLGVKTKISYESNQDFSKTQLVPSVYVGIGAKGWDNNGLLKKLNLFDYPFALLRLLTGTDKKFEIYGASFPSCLFGLDYVIPSNDTLRQKLQGDLEPFTRFKFEAGFRTRVAHIGKELIHFSSDFRWYSQLKPGKLIKAAGLHKSTFFVSIESSSGLFASYTTGKLPFDVRNDQVYAIGFHYDLGNWKK
jgi:hypothetical protein